MLKKLIFGYTRLHEICGFHTKKMTDTVGKSQFLQKMNEQPVEVNRLFKNLTKPYGVVTAIPHPSPFPLCTSEG